MFTLEVDFSQIFEELGPLSGPHVFTKTSPPAAQLPAKIYVTIIVTAIV